MDRFVIAIKPVGDHWELGTPGDEGFQYCYLPPEWGDRLVRHVPAATTAPSLATGRLEGF